MESDSSRARIDQFFVSKKIKKTQSPCLKSERAEKDTKVKLEGSPSAKGSLDNYLVSSQDDNRTARHLQGATVSLNQGPVKRNLTREINTLSRDESRTCSSALADRQTSEAYTKDQKDEIQVLSSVPDASAISNVNANRADAAGSCKLEQFASHLFSLYCRDLPPRGAETSVDPKLNANKRQGSPSTLVEGDKLSKKRHYDIDMDEGHPEVDVTSCVQKHPENMLPSAVSESGEPVLNYSREIYVGTNSVELQSSLRKCSRMSSTSVCKSSEGTPVRVHETPKSTRGSSLFSPGEAFWSEAIQVADGFVTNGNCSAQASQDIGATTMHGEMKTLKMLGNVGEESMSKKVLNEAASRVSGVDMNAEFTVKLGKAVGKEASPFPVKHFDFSFEDKNLDEDTLYHTSPVNAKGLMLRKCGQTETTSVNSRDSAHATKTSHSNLNMPLQEVTICSDVGKRKAGYSNHARGSIESVTPAKETGIVNDTCIYNMDKTPSSYAPMKNRLDIAQWLPFEVCGTYKKKGISNLYPWQVDCLQVDGVLQKRNLVYCASTSAGKSFVAEILMLRRVLSSGKMALLVLPYVSICAEKAAHLEVLLEPLGKHVRSYYGNQGGGSLPKDTSVAVCTIEKANSLINKLLEEGRLSEVGIIVIDELHMVGDQSRGYLLELMLTKLRYAAGDGNTESSSGESSSTSSGKTDPAHGLQIVGMSATLPNVAAVADWLQAALYQTDFRPVPLEEYIKVGNTIYNKTMEIVRTIPKAHDLGGKDPDHIVELCNEVVQEGNSVLLFCPSRKGCESTAKHISKFLKKSPVSAHEDKNEFMDIASAIESLRRSPAGLDPILEETLPSGVAYHHAGLTVEEREVVETCYRKGLVRVLTATSTLAAGVNLPARRVIFRQPRIGRDFIDGTKYRQMAGRAGRTGIDTKGESVLLCKPEEVKRILGILNDSCPPLHSCLSEDKNGMTHAILEVVAGGIVQTANDVHRYVRCTLLNSTKPFKDVVKSAQESLKWLCHRKFLEWNEDTKLYSSTPLGRASFGSSLSPEESLIVLDDLIRAREGFVLSSDLHLVYLVTPTNVEVEPDWELYYERFMQLSPLDQSVGNRVGVIEPFLMHMAHGGPMRTSNRFQDNKRGSVGMFDRRAGKENKNTVSDEQTLRVCKRFYVALILSRLVQEAPVAEVCESFKVARGMVQALQENAGRFASMVSAFCERLGWHDLEGLVSKFQNRVSFGVRAEIVELTTIPFVKGSRARVLYKAGLRTPQAVAEASISEILKALSESSTWAAQEDPAQRRIQLGVAKKIKNGARKIVLEKAEEARLVAFSAFKSLGLDVPQFPELPSLNAVGNASEKEASTSSGGETSSSVVGLSNTENISAEPKIGSKDLGKVSSDIRVQNSMQVGDMVLGTAIEVKPAISPENIVVVVEEPVIPGQVNVPIKGADGAGTSYSGLMKMTGNEKKLLHENFDCGHQEQNDKMLRTPCHQETTSDKGPLNAVSTPGGFDSFLNLWDSSQEFYFDIHFSKRSEVNSMMPYELQGLAICWANSPVYYINIPKDLFWVKSTRSNPTPESCSANDDDTSDLKYRFEMAMKRWTRIGEIIGKKDVRKFTWNLKVQIKVLKSPAVSVQRPRGLNNALKMMGVELIDSLYYMLTPVYAHEVIDLSIVAWILWPDEAKSSNPNLEKEAKKRLSNEVAAAACRSGRWKNQMRPAAHNGCCRRAAQIRALCSVLWKLVVSEKLVEALTSIEAPLVKILADMEIWGIGVDMEGCLHARHVLRKKLTCLEQEAYDLAGVKFSLSSSTEIADILYKRLKLPMPDGRCNKSKQHPSTNKHSLDFLRNEHPIIPVIKEHRTLAKLLNSTLGSICQLARLSLKSQKYMLHGHWLQTSTATGRLSTEEPNLQCVEHMVEFSVGNCGKEEDNSDFERIRISARDFFIPTQENWILLAADYSQIELRLMAHFSKDTSLIELLSKPHGDVFIMITAKWAGKEESNVTSQERDHTKRLIYGILYGMGPNSLAEQLNCSLDDATEKIKSFKRCFPGVASWLREAVVVCRENGYVETLKGRRRFLSKIKLGNSKERSKAERQAVNSICQGSAADIIKIAMINIHSLIVGEIENCQSSTSFATNFSVLRNRCRILLQVHDELVLEADASVMKEAALLLQMSMERAASLLVPLRVKLKAGKTWGSLEPFSVEQPADGS